MKLVTAVIRPQQVYKVTESLSNAGFNAFSKWNVLGRGKQKGIKVGEVVYEELPKEMIYIVVDNSEKDEVIDIIINVAKTGDDGCHGDGKIFVTDIEEEYTIGEKSGERKS